jgi:hypothetical protein
VQQIHSCAWVCNQHNAIQCFAILILLSTALIYPITPQASTMLAPNSQSRHSNGSLLRSSTGAAIRRGELIISDPIPQDYDTTRSQTIARHNSDWPIKATAAEPQRGRHFSTGNMEPHITRQSMGPSLVASSMSTTPSKTSSGQKKTTGFRATLRRMFGSKRGRPSFEEPLTSYHRSVRPGCQFFEHIKLMY